LYGLGKIAESLEVLDVGVRKYPESDLLFAPYACGLANANRLNEAIPWMLKAVNANPADPQQCFDLARMYCQAGNIDECLAWLNRALERGFSDYQLLDFDRVFDPIRGRPEFQRIRSEAVKSK
jgi:pentatricopeptide repeat protein